MSVPAPSLPATTSQRLRWALADAWTVTGVVTSSTGPASRPPWS